MKIPPLSMRGFFMIAVGAILLDQATKWLVVENLAPHGEIILIPRCLQLIFRTNTGAAFSVFTDYPFVLAIFSTIVAVVLTLWSRHLVPEEQDLRWSLGLILGGAIGNLIDRYRLRYVVDFIDAHWDDRYHFPTFNVADSAISVGMVTLILLSLVASRRKSGSA